MKVRVEEIDRWGDAVSYVASNMRECDREELWQLSRADPWQALVQGIEMSQERYIGFADDTPVAVFGCHTVALGGLGVPWLLGTDVLTRHPTRFYRFAARYCAHLRGRHAKLANVVHGGNAPSVLFLEALGFKLSPPYLTATGAVARDFEMKGSLDV